MKLSKKLQILSNEKRLNILQWLADPQKHFPELANFPSATNKDGVCVGVIQRKSKLTQPTTSQYMSLLDTAGLVTATRVGKWTHYKLNPKALQKILVELNNKFQLDKL